MGGNVGDAAWSFILKLVPSEKHLEKIKSFLANDKVDWNEIFFADDYCESMYYIYLLQTLIGDGSEKEFVEIRKEPSFEERTEMRKSILKHRGIQWAIDYLKNTKELITNNTNKISYLIMITHIIAIYLIASMSVNNKLPKTVKQYSFKLVKEDSKVDIHGKAAKEHFTSKFITISRNGT